MASHRSMPVSQIQSANMYDAPLEATKSWTSYPEPNLESPPFLKMALDVETIPVATFAPNRRLPTGDVAPGIVSVPHLTERNLANHDAHMAVNPYVQHYTSPIRAYPRCLCLKLPLTM